MRAKQKLKELGIKLPEAVKPLASYIPARLESDFVFTSGQISFVDGKLKYTGLVGKDLTVEEGYDAARICCINALAAVNSVVGALDKIESIVKLTGFVASAPGFTDQAAVVNGASELLFQIFGEAGKHARTAIGVNLLPFNAPVEVEMIVKLIR